MNNNRLIAIYKSRKTILELLENLGYDISDYKDFTFNELDLIANHNQLDMCLTTTPEEGKADIESQKVYVKYLLTSKISNNLENIIQDLYEIEGILQKKDTLVIIMDAEPNDTLLSTISYKYNTDGLFIVPMNIKRLQFNILKHQLVPKVQILSEEEKTAFLKEYHIKSLSQLPEISRFDPQAQAILLRPNEICKFERTSVTALRTPYYRVCV